MKRIGIIGVGSGSIVKKIIQKEIITRNENVKVVLVDNQFSPPPIPIINLYPVEIKSLTPPKTGQEKRRERRKLKRKNK